MELTVIQPEIRLTPTETAMRELLDRSLTQRRVDDAVYMLGLTSLAELKGIDWREAITLAEAKADSVR